MIDIILSMYSFINAPTFVLAAIACSFLVKIYLLTLLIPYGLRTPKIHRSWIFLVGVLVGSMFGDITWIIKLIRQLSLISLHYPLLIFFVRISWAMTVLQYQSLAFFMQSITLKQFRFTLVHLFMLIISSSFAGYFIIAACCDGDLLEPVTRNAAVLIHPTALAPFEIRMMRYIVYYLHPLQIIPFFALTLGRLYSTHLPKILRKQCSTILFFFVIPYIAAEALQAILTFTLFQKHAYAIVALSTLLIAWCIHYCIRSIIQLRFLNFEYHVIKPKHNLVFFNNFKNILEQLSHTNSLQELNQTTHSFFTQAFGIGPRKTLLHIRHKVPSATPLLFEPYTAESIIEPFINAQTTIHGTFLKQRRILIYDDLEFTHFYTENELCKTMLTFMDNIHADIFIPIYEKNKLVAYIVVEKWARNRLYSDVERDQIIIFASFIGSVINLLEHRTLTTLLGKETGLKEELYQKDQEINQYKESLKSFLRNSPQKEIGLIFYKNRRFVFGNTAAKKLVTINPNLHDGHPLTKIIKKIALQVTTYKAPQSTFTTLPDGKKLVVYGVPNVEQDTTILMLYYPEISDIITHNSNLLKDPTTRDYLLYLETTKSGQLINQLIPGSGEVLLNFKLNVLKASLSKKTVVLTMPEDDLIPTVEIIHHISLRTVLKTITLTRDTDHAALAIHLFGINPLINPHAAAQPLMQELHETGTLCIKNIEHLDHDLQHQLVHYLKYGAYRVVKGDQMQYANVRIICSTGVSLENLVQQGSFDKELFAQLHCLVMPSLESLPEQELNKLADGFTDQAIQTQTMPSLLSLTDKEKNKLSRKRPVSLHDLKKRIKVLIAEKEPRTVYQETAYVPTSRDQDDPTITNALQLGKQALKDPKIMAFLWERFKNQNQLASLLGVNRSSINRRCKEYGLR